MQSYTNQNQNKFSKPNFLPAAAATEEEGVGCSEGNCQYDKALMHYGLGLLKLKR